MTVPFNSIPIQIRNELEKKGRTINHDGCTLQNYPSGSMLQIVGKDLEGNCFCKIISVIQTSIYPFILKEI